MFTFECHPVQAFSFPAGNREVVSTPALVTSCDQLVQPLLRGGNPLHSVEANEATASFLHEHGLSTKHLVRSLDVNTTARSVVFLPLFGRNVE